MESKPTRIVIVREGGDQSLAGAMKIKLEDAEISFPEEDSEPHKTTKVEIVATLDEAEQKLALDEADVLIFISYVMVKHAIRLRREFPQKDVYILTKVD
jgi:hypothetical protein